VNVQYNLWYSAAGYERAPDARLITGMLPYW
jgi:hypothetical protein